MSELLPILSAARDVLGSDEKLAAWLDAPNPMLGDDTPLQLVRKGMAQRLRVAFPALSESAPASSPTADDYEKAIAERQKRCAPAGTFAVIEQIRERAKEIARQRGEVSGE